MRMNVTPAEDAAHKAEIIGQLMGQVHEANMRAQRAEAKLARVLSELDRRGITLETDVSS